MESNKLRSVEKSTVAVSEVFIGAICDFNENEEISDDNSSVCVLIVTLASELSTSIELVLANLSTKNPDLYLVNPSESWICKDFVSNSKRLNAVNFSIFSILSSNFPISFIVYLLLSLRDTFTESGL